MARWSGGSGPLRARQRPIVDIKDERDEGVADVANQLPRSCFEGSTKGKAPSPSGRRASEVYRASTSSVSPIFGEKCGDRKGER